VETIAAIAVSRGAGEAHGFESVASITRLGVRHCKGEGGGEAGEVKLVKAVIMANDTSEIASSLTGSQLDGPIKTHGEPANPSIYVCIRVILLFAIVFS
jgi:hypothetical protein